MKSLAVITFTPDGVGQCLYTELVDLRALGRLECRRASVVEFNADTQNWEVRCPGAGAVSFAHPSRHACLEWEMLHLQ